MTTDVSLKLDPDEALVLFEWVTTFNRREDVEFDDQAEQRVLWDIQAMLEAALAEPLRGDYHARLQAARARVRDSDD